MDLEHKKKQRKDSKGGTPLELEDEANEAAESAKKLDDVLGDIDRILNDTAKTEEYCCVVRKVW